MPPAPYAPPTYAGPGYPPPGHPPYPVFVPPPLAPNGQPLASFTDRLLAWLIDTAVATLLGVVLLFPVFIWLWFRMFTEMVAANPDGTLPQPDPVTMMTDFFVPVLLAEAGLVVVLLVFYWFYHVEYARRTGQTLGKRLLKIRIIPVDPSAVLTRGMLGRRWLVEFGAGSLVPFLHYVDGLWQLWDKPWQQCLHDKFAATVVVKVAP
ncbi:RDD family protein [Micromonospora narathiwatensis]|uniref:RDD family protein n=1 Tax=Micromonospora narathiwatensis TaxID=299146 RepID=A0A1A9A8F3_9ACTN|nr:RDD family protein [Micromonospora narathiwatensis]